MERAKESLDKDYYKILGIPRTANFEDLRTAYRRKALLVHPDRMRTEDAARKFIELNDAYRYLADPARRAGYDRLFRDIEDPERAKAPPAGPTMARRKSEAGLRMPTAMSDRDRPKSHAGASSTAEQPQSTPDGMKATESGHSTNPQSADNHTPPKFAQAPVTEQPEPTPSPQGGPAPCTNTEVPPIPERTPSASPPVPRKQAEDRKQARSTSAAPPPKRPWQTTPSISDPTEDMTDISIGPQRHMPRSRSRSRSRPRPAKEEVVPSSDTDVSHPAYFRPLKAFSPATPSVYPTACVYPLRLTLAELYTGCVKRFVITRYLLSGRTEEGSIDVQVQPGWRKGTRITYARVGSEIAPGVYQDIVFIVRYLPDVRFAREGVGGENLVGTWGLRLVDALTAGGTSIARIQTLDGRELKVILPKGIIKPGDTTVVTGEGMPIRKGGKVIGKGNLIIRWTVLFPDGLTPEESAQLRPLLSNQAL